MMRVALLRGQIGGIPLGLKRGSSKNLDARELEAIVMGFEQQNSVKLKISAEVVSNSQKQDLVWTAVAIGLPQTDQAGISLAYSKYRCGERLLVTMEAVILQLLYALDFQLAENEVRPKGSEGE
jgi:hypothetical protein